MVQGCEGSALGLSKQVVIYPIQGDDGLEGVQARGFRVGLVVGVTGNACMCVVTVKVHGVAMYAIQASQACMGEWKDQAVTVWHI
jgi:hypothetical protein